MSRSVSHLVAIALLAALVMLSGCASLQSAVGQSTYDPATYGTDALLTLLGDGRPVKSDAVAAAVELRSRHMDDVSPELLCAIAAREELHPLAKVEFINTLILKESAACKDCLRDLALSDESDKVASTAGTAFARFTLDENEKLSFLKSALWRSAHPLVRTRAAIALRSFGPQVEAPLLQQLAVETSAPVAMAICEALVEFSTPEGMDVLRELSNDVERTFTTASLWPEKRKIHSDDVRAFVVRAVEDNR